MASVFPEVYEIERIEAELAETCAYAKRQARILGWNIPTKWDDAHDMLDLLLEDWQAARGNTA